MERSPSWRTPPKKLLALHPVALKQVFTRRPLRLAMEIEHSGLQKTTKPLSSRPIRRSIQGEGCAQGRPKEGSRLRCGPQLRQWNCGPSEFSPSLELASAVREVAKTAAPPERRIKFRLGLTPNPEAATTTRPLGPGPLGLARLGLGSRLRALTTVKKPFPCLVDGHHGVGKLFSARSGLFGARPRRVSLCRTTTATGDPSADRQSPGTAALGRCVSHGAARKVAQLHLAATRCWLG